MLTLVCWTASAHSIQGRGGRDDRCVCSDCEQVAGTDTLGTSYLSGFSFFAFSVQIISVAVAALTLCESLLGDQK